MEVFWRKYDLRTGDLFVLSWARVRRVNRGSISSELLMCGGVCSICIRRMFIFMSVVVTVWECLLCSGRC